MFEEFVKEINDLDTNEKRCDFVNRISKALVDGKITNKQCNELSQRLHDKCFGAGKTE